jgi:hypothetical protein
MGREAMALARGSIQPSASVTAVGLPKLEITPILL